MTSEDERNDLEIHPDAEAASAQEAADSPGIERLMSERDEFKELAARAQADLLNYRRRVDEERQYLERNAANGVVARLLPVIDDLRRAVESMPPDGGSWNDGVRMVLHNVEAVVQSVGVSVYEPAPGDTFDPAVHEAVAQAPTPDYAAGAVVACVRAGYRTADRILRAAQVVVAQSLPADSGPTNQQEDRSPEA